MRVDNISREQAKGACEILVQRARMSGKATTVFLDCGPLTVRLICHSEQFMRHVERQMTCALRTDASSYDATIVAWHEPRFDDAALALSRIFNIESYRKQRIARLTGQRIKQENVEAFNESIIHYWNLLDVQPSNGRMTAFDPENNTYYCAVENLDPEEFIIWGHVFFPLLFRICNVPEISVAHGAVLGLNGIGVLLCAFGYRGKSTLAVNALQDGFDYVSDDYFILGRKPGDNLRAWPIYSIVALSPEMYSSMYGKFHGKFVSNNSRKDKYIFNISSYHGQFRSAYPVSYCMFPHICDCVSPSIEPGYKELAVEEIVFSTLNNVGYVRDAMTAGKLYSFISDLPFYRFNLSRNLEANTRCLREFLEQRQQ